MEKIGEDSYMMTMEEFMDMIEANDQKSRLEEVKKLDAPLSLTSGQFAMVAKALIVHNIMMDTIDQQEAEMLMQFSDILEVALVEKFADKNTKKEREEN